MRKVVRFAFLLLLGAMTASPLAAQYDVLIRGGRVLDGSGNPWRRADVAITDGRISAVGDLAAATARMEVDATGLYVSPGFIDGHSHAGPGLATAELSHAQPWLAQGVTTVVVNPDGGGPTDIGAQRDSLMRDGLGTNVAQLVGHGSVRRAVIGMEDRAPTAAELQAMVDLVRSGMEEGAFGLSSGLYYSPGSYAATEEVVALARVASQFGGVYASHIRDESDYTVGVVAAVDEVIRVAREADITGIVTHIKALGPRVWGYSGALVHRIQRARDEGIRVYADQYPYEASGTSIGGALVPRWAQAGGPDSLLRRLTTPADRSRIRDDILENLDRRGGAARLQLSRHRADPSIEGRTLQEVADERGIDPADLAIELTEAGGAGLVSFNMDDGDIATLMKQPWTMTASDGGLTTMGRGGGVPHPRYYGAFPRKIRKYVREERVIDLPQAVRTMTSLPAAVFGMSDRGMIREGAVADIAVFDLERLTDKATYDDPHQLAEGMVYVFVNGEPAISEGTFTGGLHGEVLEKKRRGVS